MNVKEVLTTAEERGVKLRVDGNDLVFRAPKGALTPELRQALVAYKAELIAFFRAGGTAGLAPIPRADLDEHAPGPLSAGQARMWFFDRLAPDSPIYNLHCGIHVHGPLDRVRLAGAVDALVARHPMLRASYPEIDGHPRMVVAPPALWPLPFLDLRDDRAPDAALSRFIADTSTARFDLACGPVLRTTLVALADDHHVLVIDQHHITADATSMIAMARDLQELYRGETLPELAIRYADYVRWQEVELASDAAGRDEDWWTATLAALPRLELPAARAVAPSHAGDACEFRLSPALSARLTELARREGCTLFVTLLAVWTALLHRYSRQSDFGIGTVTANRERSELAEVVGFFVNTLVLRADVAGDPTFAELMARLRTTVTDALAHQALPFDRVVKAVGAPRGHDLNPLFRAAFGLESASTHELDAGDGAWVPRMQRVDAAVHGTAKFELGLVLVERDGGLTATLEYATALYDAATIRRIADQFVRLAEAAVASPQARVSELPLLSEAEERAITAWNATELAVPADTCLHELFAAQAARTPDAIAVESGDVALTYRELATRARRLACYLRERGVGADSLVGICAMRGPAMVVAMLAVLEAGGGYVPLDPAYPAGRLQYMLEDSGAAIVLTERALADRIGDTAVCVDELVLAGDPPVLPRVATPGNLAYCIYTSGSTGKPKGVAIEHASAVAFAAWAQATFDREDFARVVFSTSICFDLSIFELFVTLAAGGTVVIVDNGLALLDGDVRPTLLNTVPSVAQALVGAGRLPDVRVINLAGEPLRRELADALHAARPAARIYNLYGPTEYTTYATYVRVPDRGAITIGRPLANTRVYLLDEHHRPVPLGAAGEIYIAGAGLARGYLHREDLTAERFVADPFGPGRMYRTGDLGRYRDDGEIEFLGRIDHQVKVRGFRIELGEIEATLRQAAGVRDAVVVARDSALVAYVVGEAGEADLRAMLAERLPDYMVPSAFVALTAMPLTPNGKIDREALPAPARGDAAVHVAPRTPIEHKLAAVWRDVLGVPRVGATDDFFALGGHSLMATQVTSRIRAAFGIDLPIRALFEAPTVAGLARRLATTSSTPQTSLHAVASDEEVPLSFAQQRLWFLDRLDPDSSVYNIAAAARLAGALDVERLAASLQAIVVRHDVLRTRFPDHDGRARQEVVAEARLELAVVDVAPSEVTARVQAEADRPFDLARGPLVRATLLRTGSSEHVLVLVMHHAITDGWSMGVLVRELSTLYGGGTLAPLAIQYADYTRWQREQLVGERLERELSYWTRHLEGAPPAIELVPDRPRSPASRHRGDTVRVAVPAELSRAIEALGRREGVTPFMTLLAAWQVTLGRYAGQDDIVVGTPIAGRTDAELEPLIGLFVNMLALRTDLAGAPTAREVLHRAREVTLGAYAHQAVPFERLLEHVAPERDTSRSPVFQVMFVFQNAPMPALQLGDVELAMLDIASTTAKFELTLSLQETASGLAGHIEFDRDLYERATIERMARHYETVLAELVADPARPIDEIELVGLPPRVQGERAVRPRRLAPASGEVVPRTPAEELVAAVWCDVLGIPRVGVTDDFFALGGHSLLATQVISRLRSAFGVELPLRALFETPTVAGLARRLAASSTTKQPAIRNAASHDDELPLSFAQQRLWFLDRLEPNTSLYNLPAAVRMKGALDTARLAASLRGIVARHDSLRTCFPERGGRARQAIATDFSLDIPIVDVAPSELPARIRAEADRPFDLARGPLVRATLLRAGEHDHLLVLVMHHAITDGWSMGVLVRELETLYTGGTLPALPLQYADYTRWQREQLSGERLEREVAYWKAQLAGAPPAIELATDRPRPAVARHHGGMVRLALPEQLSRTVAATSRREGVTTFMTLLAAWQVMLARYSGQDDIVVGTPIAGRTETETEALIGLFVNTLALRTGLSGSPTVREVLHRVREVTLGAYAHQAVPFEKLIDHVAPERDQSRSPVFQVMFVLQNAPLPALRLGDVDLEILDIDSTTAKFELTLSLQETSAGLVGSIEYDRDLYDRATIERMARHYENVLAGMMADPARSIAELQIVDSAERRDILARAGGEATYSDARCIHELFEEQCDRHAGEVAVAWHGSARTYRELEARANRLAHHLIGRGVVAGDRVALCLDRSFDMIEAVVAVLKIGAAYVPLEPSLPAERLAYVLDDIAARVVIAGGAARRDELGDRVVDLDRDRDLVDAQSATRPRVHVDAGTCAYVIYTSGSTGKPKGVEVSHANVVRLFTSTDRWFHFGHRDVWTLFHSYAFDFSVWEIWGALLYGGRLVIVPYEITRSPDSFFELVAREGVTVLNQTPSAFRLFVAADTGAPLALRTVIFGGEAVDLASLRPWFARRGDAQPRLVNMYGITETTVHVTYRPLAIADLDGGANPIGEPIPDLRVYVLDERRQLLPIGVPGELYVGGAGVALGYLARPELTAARFVADPFVPGGRLYRTGDRGRWLAGGGLDYLGRVDHQVKIRGFRIELGEIEALLARHPAIAEVIVLVRDERLVAYVVAAGEPPSAGDLRAYLAPKLPEYMIPAAFVVLPAMPLNVNGKVDRKALPDPARLRPGLADALVAPRTPEEELLAQIWCEVLELPAVGIEDRFFELGGDSILSIQVVAKAREAGMPISVRALFQHPTIRGLAAHASEDRDDAAIAPFSLISPSDRAQLPEGVEDAYPLAKLQAGMVFHGASSSLYHDIASFHLAIELAPEQVRTALDAMAAAHPILRTSFDFDRYSEPLQLVHSRVEIPLVVEDWRHLSHADQEAALVAFFEADKQERRFDITRAPLARVCLHRRAGATWQLTLVNHHAILDGWSVAALVTELVQRLAGRDVGPPPASHYRELVALERAALASPETRRFWDARLADAPLTVLPRGDARGMPGRRLVRVPVSQPMTAGLKELARTAAVPFKSVLLAAHLRALAAIAGEPEVVTGVVANGRPEARDAERALGLYLNTVPYRQRVAEGSWLDLVRATFANECEVLPHRRYPLAELQRRQGGPLFETAFNFIHFHVYESLGEDQLARVLGVRSYEETNFRFLVNFSLDLAETELVVELSVAAPDLSDAQVDDVVATYRRVLEAMAADPAGDIRGIVAMPPELERRILVEWNATALAVPADTCLHELFEAQVARTPFEIALRWGDVELGYLELATRARRLAHHLRARGVGPDVLVGVCAARGPAMVVAMLAVLEAGGGYVPLDPAYPPARLQYMIDDSGAAIVLTERALADRIGDKAICIDELVVEGDAPVLPRVATPGNLAYCIYTSGSTGKPKGVAIEHASAVAFVAWAQATFDREDLARVLFSTSICFDLSIFELFVTLAVGGTVVLVDNALALLEGAHDVTMINTVPSAAQALVEAGRVPDVRVINLAGEPLRRELADALHAARPAARIFNLYGPTEYTTYATYTRVPDDSAITIGRPLANTQVYILDERLAPVAPGKPGQIFIAGAGLARGYLHRDELTAERFVANPFGEGRMYKTGDLGRFRADGEIEFLGRIDHQVKIRGFRIELGEIEAVLRAAAGVRDAVVVARDGALVAYVVGEAGEGELRATLAERLPEYMVPSAFVSLATLPLTPNGKVDRKALPAPERVDAPIYVAPRTPVEEVIAATWSEVLGCPRVGANDDFFALGGHSLVATRVVSRLRATFGIELAIRALFEAPTVAALAKHIAGALGATAVASEPIVRDEAAGDAPLSFAQQRLWFLDRLQPGTNTYNLPIVAHLTGLVDVAALDRALRALAARHAVLRTSFPERDGTAYQHVAETGGELIHAPVTAGELAARIRDEVERPFDLAHGPLLRATLFSLGEQDHVLVIVLHHATADGWSMGVLARELGALYAGESLPPLAIQYADYARWQRRRITGALLERELAYWTAQLAGAPAALELATDHPRPAVALHRGASVRVELPAELARAVAATSRREGATTFMTLLAAWQLLLARYSRQGDIVVGTPIAGRTEAATEGMIGLFVNTLALRTDLSGAPTVRELLARVREVTLGAYAHQAVPFERLLEHVAPERDTSRSPVFQTMFVLQNTPAPALQLDGLAIDVVPPETTSAKFELTLALAETADGLAGGIEYDRDLYDRSTIERMARHYEHVLRGIVADPARSISAIALVDEVERADQLARASGPAIPVETGCLHDLFEAQVARTPDAIALHCGDIELGYRELAIRVRRLAHHLRARGVGPDVLVGICTTRGPAMVVAMLAVLEAGGGYVPLDPSYPPARLQYMLDDSGAAIVLTERALADRIGDKAICVDELVVEGDAPVLPRVATPGNLAYCIYTSGSTGKPKGVAIEHASAVAFVAWAQATFDREDLARVLFSTSICFDLSIFELFVTLAAGGTVVLVDNALALLEGVHDVTLINTVPSAAQALVEAGRVPDVRVINLAGEPLRRELADALHAARPAARIFNLYGPTEYTTYATYVRVPEAGPITIGRPLANTQVYILDERREPVPVDVVGEVFIAGAGLARGYLHREELTAERFVVNPFGAGRMYRTGDLGRYRASGEIEFLGRVDHQVKVRGFRIELGEIETALRAAAGVRDAVVVARDGSLVAYVVGHAHEGELRAVLAERLPTYMVPSTFVALPALPLTPNGKLDRKALPEPARASGAGAFAPLEIELARIWEHELGVRGIGPRDSFFALGGHSLAAVSLLARIKTELGEVSLARFFQQPTIEGVAEQLRGALARPWSPLVPITTAGAGRPLFCVHPGLGSIARYDALARELGSARPFYALCSIGLERDQEPDRRVELMAARYIAAIREVQPHGPYLLAGHSFGGLVAFEMARQLTAAGARVDLVALLDTVPPGPAWRDVPALDAVAARAVLDEAGVALDEDLAALAPDAQVERCLAALLAAGRVPAWFDAEHVRRMVTWRARVVPAAYREYAPARYAGTVTLLRASDSAAAFAGWSELARVVEHRVPGDHHSMLRPPHLEATAARLASCAEAVDSPGHPA